MPRLHAQPAGYEFRKRFLIDAAQISGTAALTDYPVLISVTHNDLRSVANGGGVENNSGFDVIPTDLANTQLDHELESYDPVTGAIQLWVRIPTLSATVNTEGYLYFGNSSIYSDQSVATTWSSQYVGVWHLDDVNESSGNQSPLVNNGTTLNSTGKIGGARQFAGTGDDLQDANGEIFLDSLLDFTISLWAQAGATGSDRGLIHGREPTGNDNRIQIRYDAAGQSGGGTNVFRTNMRVDNNGSKTNQRLESSNNAQTTAWQYVVLTRVNGSAFTLYLDGLPDTPTYSNAQTGVTWGNTKLVIGRGAKDGTTSSWLGSLDELRLVNVARSADWILTSFNNQNNPSTFASLQALNEAPVLAGMEGVDLNYTSQSGPQIITNSTTLSDYSDVFMDSLIVSFSAGYQATEDTLVFTPQGGITATWNDGSGTLRLGGVARTSAYDTALRTITYENSSATPNPTARTIAFQAHDGITYGNTVSRTLLFDQPNQAPALAAIEGTTFTYPDSYGDTTLTASITVTDADNAYLDSARVAFTGGYVSGEDILDFQDQLGLTHSWDGISGTLVLAGTAALADYQTALRRVTYRNVNPAPNTGTRTIQFEVRDATVWSNTQTRNLTVTPLNNAPQLSGMESAAILYNAGDGAVVLTDSILVTDGDDVNIDSATVLIADNYFSTEDVLAFTNQLGITGTWDGVAGQMTLRGTVSLASYETALRTVTYQNTATTPKSPTRRIRFLVHDGQAWSDSVSRKVASGAPGTISNLQFWLRGDAGAYIDAGNTLATDGQAVVQWNDQSGLNHDFRDNSGSPIFRQTVAALNNASALDFAGAGENFRDADGENYVNGMTEFSLFTVLQANAIGNDLGWISVRNPSGNDVGLTMRYDAVGDNSGETNVIKAGILNNSAVNQLESLADAQTTNPQIVSLNWESGLTFEMWVDGVLSNPSTQQSPPVGTINNAVRVTIGQGAAVAGQSWNGLIAEVILYDRNLSATERQKIENYFSEKYGISVGLIAPASNGDSLSVDQVGGTFTPLTGPRLTEDVLGEFAAGNTIVLDAPTGFEWDVGGTPPTVSVQPAYGTATSLAASFTGRTASQITYTINTASALPNKPGELTFGNLRVRPTSGVLPNTGNISNSGTTGPTSSVNLGDLACIPGAPTTIVFNQAPTGGNASTNLSPAVTVQLQDQFGNAVAHADTSITMTLSTGTGNLLGTVTQLTDATGLATFADLQIDQTGVKRLTAATATLGSIQSGDFTISGVGVYTTFLVERSSGGDILTQTAGSGFTIKISAVDAAQSVDANFTGTVDLSTTSTFLSGGGTTASFVAGVLASHAVNLGAKGTHTITATVTGGTETGSSNSFAVNPGAPSATSSTLTAAPTVIASNGIATSAITATIKDAYGNQQDSGGETVNLVTSAGTMLGAVTDHGDGTYTQDLQSAASPATAAVTGLLNLTAMGDTAYVQFNNYSTIWQSSPGTSDTTHEWSRASNWSNGVPGMTDAVLVPANPANGSRQPIIAVDNLKIASLTVETAADVTLAGGISFEVTGDLLGGGQVNGTTVDSVLLGGDVGIGSLDLGYVILNGTGNQTISNALSYQNLELNKSAAAQPQSDLSVSGTLTLTAGVLELLSGNSVLANTQSVTGGSIRVLREINGTTGWRMLGAPLISTYGDFLDSVFTQGYTGSDSATGSPSVLWYDETYVGSDNQRWRKPTAITDATVPGRGLFVYVFGDIATQPEYSNSLPVTLDVTGSQTLGTGGVFDFGITYTAAADTGWNLVANPFPATIDWDAAGWTRTSVDNSIYIWDASINSGNGGYLTWNGVTGSLGDGKIQPGQGFWIKANAASPQLTLNVSNKTVGGVFYKVAAPQPLIVFHVQADTLEALSHLSFTPGGSWYRDARDAFRLASFATSWVDLYSLNGNGDALWINALPDRFGRVLEVPLEIEIQEEGSGYLGPLTLEWPQLQAIPAEWELQLVDQVTGAVTDLRQTRSYTFAGDFAAQTHALTPRMQSPRWKPDRTAKAGQGQTRFLLRIDPGDAFPEIPREYALGHNYPNPFNPRTTIPVDLPLESRVTLDIFDIRGRRIVRLADRTPLPAGRHGLVWQADAVPSGVYFVRLQLGNGRSFSEKMLVMR